MFPDAVTTRGQKHVRELPAPKNKVIEQGAICWLHNGFDRFKIAEYIDPEYDRLLKEVNGTRR